MVKAILKWIRSIYDAEIDYVFEFEFSIYDVLALLTIIAVVLWMIN